METTIRIERYADQGRCVGHIDGRVVFVRFALPGELVRVVLDEPHDRDDRFWTGEVSEVLEASDNRVTPPWTLAGPLAMNGGVGGADLIHVSLDGQLAWKAATIREQMERLGHVVLDDVPVERMPGDESLGGLHWRTRIEMIADDDGRPSMRRRGTHMRVPIDTMPLASENLLAVADACHVWDGGFAPGARIRIAAPEPRLSEKESLQYSASDALDNSVPDNSVLSNSPDGSPADSSRFGNTGSNDKRENNADSNVESFVESKVSNTEGKVNSTDNNIGNKAGDNAVGRANTKVGSSVVDNNSNSNFAVLIDGDLRDGSRQLTEVVPVEGHNFQYTVDAGGFWQIHRSAPIALVNHVLNLVRSSLDGATSAVIWDLYSGSGLFSVPLATLAADRVRMLTIEGAKDAVHNAQRNLRAYGLNAVDARCGDVAATLRHVPNDLASPDAVVLDPPRAGARAKVCRAIAESGAHLVVYIACDPTSLARDTDTLVGLGYRLTDIHAFDIYPMTHHVETVALFCKQ